jgi:predicted XRE-type DNA-binding protein
MIAVQKLIANSGKNNSEIARELGVSRSRVSELMNGKIDRISLDALTEWLDYLSDGKLKVGVVATSSATKPKLSANASA